MVSLAPTGGARAVARCDLLGRAPYSDMADGLFRGYLTPGYAAAQDALADWMRDAGMTVRRDAAANLIGRYEGRATGAPALLIGSHLDSVRDAGRYDGPLGILLGVEVVDACHAAARRFDFAIEVIAFGDEEGSRFPTAMLTSRAVAGTLCAEALVVRDAEGMALADVIDTGAFLSAARPPGTTLAYFEAHIEQGPLLEARGVAVGTVTGIAAQRRERVEVTGFAAHAGTSSMELRRDALAGAAEMMVAIERVARDAGGDLVATVGWIEAIPGAANVVPGTVRFSIDVRAGDAARRDRAADAIGERIAAIAAARGLVAAVDSVHDLPASPCDAGLIDLVDAAITAAGQPACRLVSGAGHDAAVMAALCPTAMLFIRCAGGVSHNPAEAVDPADVEFALRVMIGFVERLETADVR